MSQTVTRPPPRTIAPVQQETPPPRRARTPNLSKSLLLMRVVVGLLFMGHACQKLLGWFGGEGMAAWIDTLQKAGLQPAPFWASSEAVAELVSGLLLVLGLLTPLAAAVLIADMVVAIVKVHAPKGLWSQQGGFEYNLVLIVLLVAIGLVGPGLYALDARLPLRLPRPRAFLVLAALSLIVAAVALISTAA